MTYIGMKPTSSPIIKFLLVVLGRLAIDWISTFLLQWIVEMHKNACSVWANGSTHAIGDQAGIELETEYQTITSACATGQLHVDE